MSLFVPCLNLQTKTTMQFSSIFAILLSFDGKDSGTSSPLFQQVINPVFFLIVFLDVAENRLFTLPISFPLPEFMQNFRCTVKISHVHGFMVVF